MLVFIFALYLLLFLLYSFPHVINYKNDLVFTHTCIITDTNGVFFMGHQAEKGCGEGGGAGG